MRILIISELYPNRIRPTFGIFVHNQALALQKIGHSCIVIAPVPFIPPGFSLIPRWRKYHHLSKFDVIDGIPIIYPRMFRPPGSWFLAFETFMARFAIERAINNYGYAQAPDIMHAHLAVPCGFASIRAAQRLKVPLVITARGDDLNLLPERSNAYARHVRLALQTSAHIMTVSNALAEKAKQLGATKVTTIHNGINHEIFCPGDKIKARESFGMPGNARVIGYTGWLLWSKGIKELWDIFFSLAINDPSLHMIVIGSGKAEGWLLEKIKSSGFAERLHLTGAVNPQKVCEALRACDVFVFPSYSEGMPNAVLEAMAIGLPVVSTRVGGIEEFITDEKSGYLVSIGNVDEMKAKIKNLLDSPQKSQSIGQQAKEVVALLTWETNAKQLIEIYKEAIESHGR